jgi:N-formylglutamate amidohydrolase
LSYVVAPARSIGQDADLFMDELFAAAPDLGATLLVSGRSRYVCDLNRAEGDLDAQTSPDGSAASAPHGVVWRRTTTGRPALNEPLSRTEVERRLSGLYRPYHQALENALNELQARFGYVILLCGHSMPSFGRLGERRADVVPGSQGGTTTAPEILRTVEEVSRDFRYDLAHDKPYRGGFTTQHHGRPRQGRHAVQVELSRRLYMDERTLTRKMPEFDRAQAFCEQLVRRLGESRPGPLAGLS